MVVGGMEWLGGMVDDGWSHKWMMYGWMVEDGWVGDEVGRWWMSLWWVDG